MVNVARGTVIRIDVCGSFGVVVEEGKLAKGWFGKLAGKRGMPASLETHSALTAVEPWCYGISTIVFYSLVFLVPRVCWARVLYPVSVAADKTCFILPD